ncbi:hypothetical protein EG329_011764 [Mollisiaceae sp. DMI_Dod_QoI]|nr:hypothetical protein EG329_011764 [Helotiales sp. DMI_Dod_QoI]
MAPWELRTLSRLEILLLIQQHNQLNPAASQQIPLTLTSDEKFRLKILQQEQDAIKRNFNPVQRYGNRLRRFLAELLNFNAGTANGSYDRDGCIEIVRVFLNRLEAERRAADATRAAHETAKALEQEQTDVQPEAGDIDENGRLGEQKAQGPDSKERYSLRPMGNGGRMEECEAEEQNGLVNKERSRKARLEAGKSDDSPYPKQQVKVKLLPNNPEEQSKNPGKSIMKRQSSRDSLTTTDSPRPVRKSSLEALNIPERNQPVHQTSKDEPSTPVSTRKRSNSLTPLTPMAPTIPPVFARKRSNSLKPLTPLTPMTTPEQVSDPTKEPQRGKETGADPRQIAERERRVAESTQRALTAALRLHSEVEKFA